MKNKIFGLLIILITIFSINVVNAKSINMFDLFEEIDTSNASGEPVYINSGDTITIDRDLQEPVILEYYSIEGDYLMVEIYSSGGSITFCTTSTYYSNLGVTCSDKSIENGITISTHRGDNYKWNIWYSYDQYYYNIYLDPVEEIAEVTTTTTTSTTTTTTSTDETTTTTTTTKTTTTEEVKNPETGEKNYLWLLLLLAICIVALEILQKKEKLGKLK